VAFAVISPDATSAAANEPGLIPPSILRPDDAMEWVDPPWAYDASGGRPLALHAGGTCAVSAAGDAVVDLMTGEKFALGSNAAGWLD
jgi:hypothetical protein